MPAFLTRSQNLAAMEANLPPGLAPVVLNSLCSSHRGEAPHATPTNFRTPRGLDKQLMLSLASCDWIKKLTGATGTGKSYLACVWPIKPVWKDIQLATCVCRA